MNRVFFQVMALMLLLISCGNNQTTKVERIRYVKTTSVVSMDDYTQTFPGVMQSDRYANLAFRVSGQIINLHVDFGEKVKQGQLIAELDPRDFQLQVEVTKSAYETAKAELERSKRLFAKETVSKQGLEVVENQFNAAKVNYENALNSLKDTKLYAPFTGSIEKRLASNYQRIQSGEPVVKLVDPSDLFVWFTIADDALAKRRNDDFHFTIQFSGLPGKRFEAKVKEVLDISPDGSGVPVLLSIIDKDFKNYKEFIKPGFTCQVILRVTGLAHTGVCLVPLTAVFKDDATDEDAVWIVNGQDSTIRKQVVTCGPLIGTNNVLIKKGIEPKMQVVVAGVYQLAEGQKVVIEK